MYKFFMAFFPALTAIPISVAILILINSDTATQSENVDSSSLVVESKDISRSARGERIYAGKLFTGEMISYHKPGRLASSDQYIEGRRHGFARQWFENGTLASEIYFDKGRRQGLARFWWSSGTPKSETFYVGGKKEGQARSWYPSGAKYKRTHFTSGRPIGLHQAWRENGDLFSNFEYKNGRVYGLNKADTCMGLEDEVLTSTYYQDHSS